MTGEQLVELNSPLLQVDVQMYPEGVDDVLDVTVIEWKEMTSLNRKTTLNYHVSPSKMDLFVIERVSG